MRYLFPINNRWFPIHVYWVEIDEIDETPIDSESPEYQGAYKFEYKFDKRRDGYCELDPREENEDLDVLEENEDEDKRRSPRFNIPFEGRQLFTRWRWSYPNPPELKSKTFYIKYEKPLSSIDKILLNNFRHKYLYHAIDDILYAFKSKPMEQDNLLSILYSPVISLQNHLSIDFFDIWIEEISINEVSKENKFLASNTPNLEPFHYITLRLLYTKKSLKKKLEVLW